MDLLAHFLWTFAIFFRLKKERWKAALCGIVPDLISFGPHFVLSLFAESWAFGRPSLSSIPDYVLVLYNLTHSLIVFLVVFFIVYVITRRVHWFLWGWGLHILIDIPTHSKAFFATPFLWPLSDFKVDGVSWGSWWFMVVNYSALVAVYWWLLFGSRRITDKKEV